MLVVLERIAGEFSMVRRGGEDASSVPETPDIVVLGTRGRVLAVEKPSGMLAVPGKGPEKADCAVARVRARFPDATGPLVVHRLDMDTSGVMVFGLDAPTQRALSLQFERREVGKRYVALVEGAVEGEAGEIDAPIRLDVDARPFRVVDDAQGQRALTRWRVAAREGARTRVEFEPRTGRTHQLRVHAALARPRGLGCPIVGDVLYGAVGAEVRAALGRGEQPPRGEALQRMTGAPRLMLHAGWLRVREPESGEWVEFGSGAGF